MTNQSPVPSFSPFQGRLTYGVGLAGILLFFAALSLSFFWVPGPLTQKKTIVIPHGVRTVEIGDRLAQEGAVYSAPLFLGSVKILGAKNLKAGEYEIPSRATPLEIVRMIGEGRSVVRLFTVPEGLTSAEITTLLEKDPVLTGEIEAPPEDGSLWPETYRYSYGDSRASLIMRMEKAMQEKKEHLWSARAPDLPIQRIEEALTLASLIEKETSVPQERPKVAGVFYNRLAAPMRLQSDPTVIYALTEGRGSLGRELTHEDLAVSSPFNTYARAGLPPHPICNPGQASIEAALHPAHHGYFYFVATGQGGHSFAADLPTQSHNINVWHRNKEAASPK